MRRALILAGLVVGLAFAAPGAQAQQSAAIVMRLEPQEDALTVDNRSVTLPGVATLIADPTVHSSPHGIPVTYAVTKAPAWATVVVSPGNDVFPMHATPSGSSQRVTLAFAVDVLVDAALEESRVDVVEVTATTSPPPGGKATLGRVVVPLVFVGEGPVCDAANPFAGIDAPEEAGAEADLTVQGGGMPVGTPWLAVGGFGLVGAGAGLLLRRRL